MSETTDIRLTHPPGGEIDPNEIGASASLRNLPDHPALARVFPYLRTAFDAERMRADLQRVLFGGERSPVSLGSCSPGKAFLGSEENCLLQYSLKVAAGDRRFRLLVNARLFHDPARAQVYSRQMLAPLAEEMRGRPELRDVPAPIAVLPELAMAVSVFPIDGLLPTLPAVTDVQRMTGLIDLALLGLPADHVAVQDIRIELAHYGRYGRCVLRYWLEVQDRHRGEKSSHLVYGKVGDDGSHRRTLAATRALTEWIASPRNPVRFRIPQIYGYRPDLWLLLMEAVPGEASFSRMLKERVRGEQSARFDTPLLEEAIAGAGRVAASLQASGVEVEEKRTFEEEIRSLRREIHPIQSILPEVGDRLISWLDDVEAVGARQPAMPICLSHGDYTSTQFIYDREKVGLVDFDNVCLAEPGLDLGSFLAYLRFNIRKEALPDTPFPPDAIDQLCAVFVNAYLELAHDRVADEAALEARIKVYEALSLVRLAVHSWQKLKGGRFVHVMTLLEERVPCLTQVS